MKYCKRASNGRFISKTVAAAQHDRRVFQLASMFGTVAALIVAFSVHGWCM